MAILLDASGEYLSRTAGAILDINAAYTVAGWVKVTVTDATVHNVFVIDRGNFVDYDRLVIDWFNGAPGGEVVNGGTDSGKQYGADALTINTFYHLAMVRESATSLKIYRNAVLEVTIATSIAGRASATRMGMGALPEGSEAASGLVIAAWNAWSRALDATELTSQMAQAAPTNTTSLFGEWLMLAGAQGDDSGGTSHAWTVNGTPTNVADPNITYPSAGGGTGFMTLRTGYWGT